MIPIIIFTLHTTLSEHHKPPTVAIQNKNVKCCKLNKKLIELMTTTIDYRSNYSGCAKDQQTWRGNRSRLENHWLFSRTLLVDIFPPLFSLSPSRPIQKHSMMNFQLKLTFIRRHLTIRHLLLFIFSLLLVEIPSSRSTLFWAHKWGWSDEFAAFRTHFFCVWHGIESMSNKKKERSNNAIHQSIFLDCFQEKFHSICWMALVASSQNKSNHEM